MNFAKLHKDAKLPTRKHVTDAGIDLYSYEDTTVQPHTLTVVHTGIVAELPTGYAPYITGLFFWPKGRSNHLIGAGVIDFGYDGELLVKVINFSLEPLQIKKGDAICQMVLMPVIVEDIVEKPLSELFLDRNARITDGITKQVTTITASLDFNVSEEGLLKDNLI